MMRENMSLKREDAKQGFPYLAFIMKKLFKFITIMSLSGKSLQEFC